MYSILITYMQLFLIQTYNITWMQGNNSDSNACWCVESYTHYHAAVSPAFDIPDYNSIEYSTWAESKLVLYVYTVLHIPVHVLYISIHVFGGKCNLIKNYVHAIDHVQLYASIYLHTVLVCC